MLWVLINGGAHHCLMVVQNSASTLTHTTAVPTQPLAFFKTMVVVYLCNVSVFCFVFVFPRHVIKLESLSMQSFPSELILLRNLNSRVIHVLAWFVYCMPSCLLNSIPLFGRGMVHLKLLVGEDANKIVTFTCVWLSC